jgi:hypothetical protein
MSREYPRLSVLVGCFWHGRGTPYEPHAVFVSSVARSRPSNAVYGCCHSVTALVVLLRLSPARPRHPVRLPSARPRVAAVSPTTSKISTAASPLPGRVMSGHKCRVNHISSCEVESRGRPSAHIPDVRALPLGMSSARVTQGGGSDRGDAPGRQRNRTPGSVEPSARTYRVITIWTAAASSLALVSVALFAYQVEKPFRVFGTGMVVAAAAAFTGALFGFIFGVPRVLASDRPQGRSSPNYGGSAPIVANTNLEQISDWLTKILVGVGLTQFALIARTAGQLFAGLAPSFGGGEVGTAFAGALILYMITFGFSTGWLFTRLFLGRAMAAADRSAAALDLMEKAERAEQAGDDDAARTYRTRARDVLEQKAGFTDIYEGTGTTIVSGPVPPTECQRP